MYDDNYPQLHLVRNQKTNRYWWGTKNTSQHALRPHSRWTDDPAKAWKSWQDLKQVRSQFEGHFPKGEAPKVDIIVFEMHDVGVAWDKDHDQDAKCECGHTYERHFDTGENMRGVGCKYGECDTFRSKEENDG